MAYVVKKPLNIAGRRREIGEVLTDDEVQGASVIRSGLVAFIPGAETQGSTHKRAEKAAGIFVPIATKNGTESVSVSAEGIYEAFLILQMTQAEALPEIGKVEDYGLLQIVGACAGSTKVKTAAREKAAAIKEAQVSKGGK